MQTNEFHESSVCMHFCNIIYLMDQSDHLKSKMEYITNVNHNKFLVGQNIKTVLFWKKSSICIISTDATKINDDKRATTTPKKKNVNDHE